MAVAFDPAAPAAKASVKVVVTVTGEVDGKINIGVKCGDGDGIALAAKDYDVTNGKATSDAFDAPGAPASGETTCTATASGTVGGEDHSETGTFKIAAASNGGLMAYTNLMVSLPTANTDLSDNESITVEATKPASGDTLTDEEKGVKLQKVCVASNRGVDANSAWVDIAGATGTLVDDAADTTQVTASIPIANVATAFGQSATQDCHVRVVAKIGVNSAGERVDIMSDGSVIAVGN